MSISIEANMQQPIPMEERLMEKGVIEDLTREGRVITVWEAIVGVEKRSVAHVFVPPEGISFGDKAWYSPGGGIEFFYGREFKGTASLIEVKRSKAKELVKRRDKILELIGRAGIPPYESISDEDADELLEQVA